MPMINCAVGALSPYVPSTESPWNTQRAMHLFRRMTYGADPQTIQNALGQNPAQLAESLVQQAVDMPLTPDPEWAYWQLSDYDPDEDIRNEQLITQLLGWGLQLGINMRDNGFRDVMTFFWHNHFVTKQETYGCPSWLFQYFKVLQKYAVGNFKEFVREIGVTPAMLVFLNNVQNTLFDPNENYARELYELFTLGVDNGYTQNDIVETARAITGYNGVDFNDLCGPIEFIPFLWDGGVKTIFGQTGNWGYDDVINILFDQRADEISEYICGKLYKHFVNPREDDQVIADLAQIFRDSDWELAPVLKALFSSEHFFDYANIGTVIPGHIEYSMGILKELAYPPNDDITFAAVYAAGDYDQAIFNPTDVAGWPGNRNWINSSSIQFRWELVQAVIGYYYQLDGNSVEHLRQFSLQLVEADKISDPEHITRTFIDYFLPKGLQFQQEYDEALVVFKAEVPENYFEDGTWSLNWEYAPLQVFLLLVHISNLPEYQLK